MNKQLKKKQFNRYKFPVSIIVVNFQIIQTLKIFADMKTLPEYSVLNIAEQINLPFLLIFVSKLFSELMLLLSNFIPGQNLTNHCADLYHAT